MCDKIYLRAQYSVGSDGVRYSGHTHEILILAIVLFTIINMAYLGGHWALVTTSDKYRNGH